MIADKKKFLIGLLMMISFMVALVFMFVPAFDGMNMLDEVDDLFNRVSKSSADYIAAVEEEAIENTGVEVSFQSTAEDEIQADRIAGLYREAGADATVEADKIKVSGDIGEIMMAATEDARLAFDNEPMELVVDTTGKEKPLLMYDWYTAIDTAQKNLQSERKFDDQELFMELNEKAVEPAYNYYGITASSPSSEAITITIALLGYVLYTLWYGFSILFMFEGWGIKMGH